MNVISVIITIVVAFGVTVGSGFVIIPWLKKLKFGQTILDIGPSWHKSKQGTPQYGWSDVYFRHHRVVYYRCANASFFGRQP